MAEESFPPVDHVGVVVRDMNKAIEFFQSLGIGPFAPTGVSYNERVMLGRPVANNAALSISRHAPAGSVRLQLVQPIAEETHWKQFLDSKGEGIQHMGFVVKDLDKLKVRLLARGFRILSESKFHGGGGAIYFDPGELGMLMEFIEWPSK